MNILKNPPREDWEEICTRPGLDAEFLRSSLRNLIERVRLGGDDAVREFTSQYDRVNIRELRVSEEEISEAVQILDDDLKNAIQVAADNIWKFHEKQVPPTAHVETMPGVKVWRKAVPIEKVGIYVPGGTAPLFSSVLMMAVPASIAGCHEIVLCTPPNKEGRVHPAILYAAQLTGVKNIFKIGGAQAIAAMSCGTESVPSVYKIYGPGNQYVTMAKQLVSEDGTAIDMPAGPSEVAVLSDHTAQPSYIAADLLSQAEHGSDSQVIFVTTDPSLPEKVKAEVDRQVAELPRKEMAREALKSSKIIYMDNLDNAVALINFYAAEHLIVQTENLDNVAEKITNAGSVFLGNYTPESAGDYASGTNHTLPTNANARAYSGLSTESFMKYITFQQISKEGLSILGPIVEKMAEAEELQAHKNAVSIRLTNG